MTVTTLDWLPPVPHSRELLQFPDASVRSEARSKRWPGRCGTPCRVPGSASVNGSEPSSGHRALLPLLMRARNGAGWTRDERIQLWHHLRQVASLSPYLIVLLTPGSIVLLPVVA